MTGTLWDSLDFVVVDVEGNGAHPPELVELAVVPIRRGVIGEARTWLVYPPSPITWQARRVHGISDADLSDAPTIDQVSDDILTALHGAGSTTPAIAGHNVHVDLDVLTRALPGWSPPVAFDTLKLARHLWTMPTYRLGALVEARHLDQDLPPGRRPHRAAYDALVTARLFIDLATSATVDGLTIDALHQHAATTHGPSGPDTHHGAPSGPTLFDLP